MRFGGEGVLGKQSEVHSGSWEGSLASAALGIHLKKYQLSEVKRRNDISIPYRCGSMKSSSSSSPKEKGRSLDDWGRLLGEVAKERGMIASAELLVMNVATLHIESLALLW